MSLFKKCEDALIYLRQLDNEINNVYLSIGTKYHKDVVNEKFNNNGYNQILPSFLRNNENKSLVIVIDTFNENELDNIYMDLEIMTSTNDIKYVVINHFCTKKNIKILLQTIVELLEKFNVDQHHFIIANYIRFYNNPNIFEVESERDVPVSIQEQLDNLNEGKYKGCFYQWFGYREKFYNYLYCYKERYIFSCNIESLSLIEKIISKFENSNSTIVIQNEHIIKMMKNILCITEPYYYPNKIGISLYDILQIENRINLIL